MKSKSTSDARKRLLSLSQLMLSEKMGVPAKTSKPGAARRESPSLHHLRDQAVDSLRKPGLRGFLL